MQLLKDMIQAKGRVLGDDILKVDSFLNQQVDTQLMLEIGKEFHHFFGQDEVTKILTVESSGIAPALATAMQFLVPMVFARKHQSVTTSDDNYSATVYSFTKKKDNQIFIDKHFLSTNDKVLIIDDFLANGQAVNGLMEICKQAKADVVGVGVVIEKRFQKGHRYLVNNNVRLKALTSISSLSNEKITFAE